MGVRKLADNMLVHIRELALFVVGMCLDSRLEWDNMDHSQAHSMDYMQEGSNRLFDLQFDLPNFSNCTTMIFAFRSSQDKPQPF